MVGSKEQTYKVEMIDVSKSYSGVKAVEDVDFNLRAGEIHSLVGENGAGKSTLMGILAGSRKMDSGEIRIDGEKVELASPVEGINHGISIIYQELALIDDLSVAENIFLDELRDSSKTKLVNWSAFRTDAEEMLTKIGFDHIDVTDRVKDLSVAYQQSVEICKAIARESDILIVDEPTAVLSNSEAEVFLELLMSLRDEGVSIIYISHRLDEVLQISDRITVLKDGKKVATIENENVTKQQLVNMMIGRTLQSYYPKREVSNPGKVVLKVEHLSSGARVKDVSFDVREGEVVGFSGLVGSGRTETLEAIYGAREVDGGDIYINGELVKIGSPVKAVEKGISLLPEDRKTEGVILNLPIRTNLTIGALDNFTNSIGWINGQEENEYVEDLVQRLGLKFADLDDPVSSLSGGNQQKASIGKLLALNSKILLMDEPTRGIDVGSKIEIFKIINELVAANYAVIMVSSEMAEVIGMCDRAFIFREGRTVCEMDISEMSEQNIMNYAMGVK